MEELARTHYASAYALAYFGALAGMAVWEALAPRRALTASLRLRWSGNFAITLLQSLLTWWLFPLASIGVAILAADRGWGLFRLVDAPYWLSFAITLAALDLSRYAQHRLQHSVPLLWRLHRMHHTDQDFDFTTALRFHPLDALLTSAIAFAVVAGLGAPVAAVALYELAFVLMAMFAHGNVRLPGRADALLRRVLITPDMHRIHHSTALAETNSNYGGVVSWWDRLFGSYVAEPAAGHEGMSIGLAAYRDRRHLMLHRMLADPFMGHPRPAPSAAGLRPADAR
jgi:sterol desaturase/sphingolipid hydroxylase (fatty acid hydroxylase superfamily)